MGLPGFLQRRRAAPPFEGPVVAGVVPMEPAPAVPTPELVSASEDAHELVESFRLPRADEPGVPRPGEGAARPGMTSAAGLTVPAVLDLDRPLRGCPVAVIDTETTGIDTAEARIVEVAVVLIDALGESEPRVALSTRVNPGVPIPPDATKVHGIGDADVVGAPTWAEVAPKLRELTAGYLPCGYNAPYDYRVLQAETTRLGTAAGPAKRVWTGWLDPLVLVRGIDKWEKGKTLSAAAQRRGVVHAEHGATADAVATAHLLPVLLREAAAGARDRRGTLLLQAPRGVSVAGYLAWQRETALAQEVDLARFFAQSGRREPIDWTWHRLEGIEPPAIATREPDAARCSSCSAPIVWVITKAGARTPCDVEEIELVLWRDALDRVGEADLAAAGTPRGFYLGADAVPCLRVPKDWRPEVPRTLVRQSHFATCPQADRHRRPAPERPRGGSDAE